MPDQPVAPDREALVRAGAVSMANVMRLPQWMQAPALGCDMTPVAELVVDALLPHLAVLLDRARQQGRAEAAERIEAEADWMDRSVLEERREHDLLIAAARLARGSQTAPSATENAETGGGA